MAKKQAIKYSHIFIKGYKELVKKDDEQVDQADVRVLASTEHTDRDMEIIKQDGIDLKQFKANPVILFGHNYHSPPIGKSLKTVVTEKGLEMDIKFASKKANPLAPQIQQLMKEGILKAVSIGFIPKERDEEDSKIITKSELLELSIVPVPANPHALALAMSKGYSKKLFEATEEKGGHEKPRKPRKPRKTLKEVLAQLKQETTEVQTLILSKENFPTRASAVKWARDHDFRSDKVDETEDSWRLRQLEPSACQEGSFRTIELTEGVKAVICRPVKGVCAPIKKIDVNKTISSVSKKLNESSGKKEPSRGEARSDFGQGITVKLPRSVILELNRETKKAYRQNELVITLTKNILRKIDEKNNQGN